MQIVLDADTFLNLHRHQRVGLLLGQGMLLSCLFRLLKGAIGKSKLVTKLRVFVILSAPLQINCQQM
jgi:hypothetical protein